MSRETARLSSARRPAGFVRFSASRLQLGRGAGSEVRASRKMLRLVTSDQSQAAAKSHGARLSQPALPTCGWASLTSSL